MKNQILRIEYIYHSGFMVELANRSFIFDYFKGTVNFKKANSTYVFASHVHSDHFNPLILDWQKELPDIHYILSSDIRPNIKLDQRKDNLRFISPYEEQQINDINIKAYNSTDEGVSFLVQQEGISIFHAGDLNWWYWCNDSKPEIEKAETKFKEEIAKIKGEQIDVAFFPVDPRLEHNYSLGAEYFIQEIKPQILIPMHFGADFKAIKQFAAKMQNSSTKIIALTQGGQTVML